MEKLLTHSVSKDKQTADPKRNSRLFKMKPFIIVMFALVLLSLTLIIGNGFLHIYWEMPKTGNKVVCSSSQADGKNRSNTINNNTKNNNTTCKPMTFSSCNAGLAWPIEDFSSITVLITHGIHCIQLLGSNETHHFHREHCMDLIHKIHRFYKQSPDYSVPLDLCRDFQTIAFPGGRVRRGSWGGWRRGKRETATVQPATTGPGSNEADSQDIGFKETATWNFEQLLWKEKSGAELSQKEKAYLETTRTPQTVRIAALGIYCKYEGYLGVIDNLVGENETPKI